MTRWTGHVCATCPWRRGSTADRIPHFSIDLARTLCRPLDGDQFAEVMACHGSPEHAEHPCSGYASSDEGWANLSVRLQCIENPDAAKQAQRDRWQLDLFDTWAEALDNLEQTHGAG